MTITSVMTLIYDAVIHVITSKERRDFIICLLCYFTTVFTSLLQIPFTTAMTQQILNKEVRFDIILTVLALACLDHFALVNFYTYQTKLINSVTTKIREKYYQLFTNATFEWLEKNENNVDKRREAVENCASTCGYFIRPCLQIISTMSTVGCVLLMIFYDLGLYVIPLFVAMGSFYHFYHLKEQSRYNDRYKTHVDLKCKIRASIPQDHLKSHDKLLHNELDNYITTLTSPEKTISHDVFQLDKDYIMFWFFNSFSPVMFNYLILCLAIYHENFGIAMLILQNKGSFHALVHEMNNIHLSYKTTVSNCEPLKKMVDTMDIRQKQKPQIITSIFPIVISNINLEIPNGTHLRQQDFFEMTKTSRILFNGPSGVGKNKGTLNFSNGLTPEDLISYRSLFQCSKTQENTQCSWKELIINGLAFDKTLFQKVIKLTKIDGKIPTDNYDALVSDGLSTGECTRFGLARALYRALIKKNCIIFMDEPDQGLQEPLALEIMQNIFIELDVCLVMSLHFDTRIY